MASIKEQIYLIAGMHRSGTSLLSHSLNILGLELPESTQPGSFDNAYGHFESSVITQYHEKILSDMGLSWDTFISPSEDWFLSKYADQAIDDLQDNIKMDYVNSKAIVLKDPRISLFIPLWKKVTSKLGFQAYYLIPLRHPYEVAESLLKRNKINRSMAIMIWLNYNLNVERFTRDFKRAFIVFPQWANNISKTIDKIENDLNIVLPNKKSILSVTNIFEKNLVHHNKSNIVKSENEVEQLALDVFDVFLNLSLNPSDTSAISKLNAYREEFEQHTIFLKDIYKDLEQKLSQSEQKLSQSEQKLSSLQEKFIFLENSHESTLKENKQLALALNHEKFSILKPAYRQFHRFCGHFLRAMLPSSIVESIKKFTPHPDSIRRALKDNYNKSSRVNVPFDELNNLKCDGLKSDIFVLSIINWDYRYQRPQHISNELSDAARCVVYLEMDLANKDTEISRIKDNVYVARLSRTYMDGYHAYEYQATPNVIKNWLSNFYELCDSVNSTSHKRIIIQHPFWWQFVKHLSPEFEIIYDCMDDISCFSNTKQFVIDDENDLIMKCDKLVVSSENLFNKYTKNRKTYLVRNGAETTHFMKPVKQHLKIQYLDTQSNDKIKSINVGYVGAIAEWFDCDLVKSVAKSLPEYKFHLCGAVTDAEYAKLEQHDNIHLHGEIPYKDVPAFIHEMDVMIIPFKITPIIQSCDPVKFYEYCAAGKPTVTTMLPELARAGNLPFFAKTSKDFAQQICKAYEKGKIQSLKKQLKEYACLNTWNSRGKEFIKILDDMPKISIIILSYGDPELTKSTLFSLYENGPYYPNIETIIVDNGSSSKSLNELSNFSKRFPNISIIENGENLGFARGNNVGLKAATGDYVLLLNNDTFVAPGSLFAMMRHLIKNPKIGVVGPLTNNIGNEAKLFVNYQNMKEMKLVAREHTLSYRDIYSEISVVAYFAAMFRRNDLKTFGLLPEEYGQGMFEDDDHCAVIKSKGYICALAEDAFIHHEHSASFSKLKDNEMTKLFNSNKKIYEERWGPWIAHVHRESRPESHFK